MKPRVCDGTEKQTAGRKSTLPAGISPALSEQHCHSRPAFVPRPTQTIPLCARLDKHDGTASKPKHQHLFQAAALIKRRCSGFTSSKSGPCAIYNAERMGGVEGKVSGEMRVQQENYGSNNSFKKQGEVHAERWERRGDSCSSHQTRRR